jgi:hypothetical protein
VGGLAPPWYPPGGTAMLDALQAAFTGDRTKLHARFQAATSTPASFALAAQLGVKSAARALGLRPRSSTGRGSCGASVIRPQRRPLPGRASEARGLMAERSAIEWTQIVCTKRSHGCGVALRSPVGAIVPRRLNGTDRRYPARTTHLPPDWQLAEIVEPADRAAMALRDRRYYPCLRRSHQPRWAPDRLGRFAVGHGRVVGPAAAGPVSRSPGTGADGAAGRGACGSPRRRTANRPGPGGAA